jgi:hypothetical protein
MSGFESALSALRQVAECTTAGFFKPFPLAYHYHGSLGTENVNTVQLVLF